MAPFSPCLAQWELTHLSPDELKRPSAREFDAALLFVDISGFTNLCTRLDIDALQHHINSYFGVLIDVVTSYGGDVLRFAGDALYCAWSLHTSDRVLSFSINTAIARTSLRIQTFVIYNVTMSWRPFCKNEHFPYSY